MLWWVWCKHEVYVWAGDINFWYLVSSYDYDELLSYFFFHIATGRLYLPWDKFRFYDQVQAWLELCGKRPCPYYLFLLVFISFTITSVTERILILMNARSLIVPSISLYVSWITSTYLLSDLTGLADWSWWFSIEVEPARAFSFLWRPVFQSKY